MARWEILRRGIFLRQKRRIRNYAMIPKINQFLIIETYICILYFNKTRPNGKIYKGEWREGKMHGEGEL